ncbi:MAG: C-GCAxxG-C-C family protein [Thermodesulfobacteriota bacterium]
MLAAFGRNYGLDQDLALKLGRAFGAGMGMGRTCGAVTGALMVLGFKAGRSENEREARYRTYDLVKSFWTGFEQSHGTTVCQELLGVDLATEEGRRLAVENKLFSTVCPAFVETAARLLSEIRP